MFFHGDIISLWEKLGGGGCVTGPQEQPVPDKQSHLID